MQKHAAVIILLIALGVGLLAPPAARAHAFLDHADPRGGSTVRAAPGAVSLTFTEPVEASFCRIDVHDAHGQAFSAGVLEHPKPEELRLPLPVLSAGRYTVHWTVTSVDTHQTEGRFEFTVSAP